MRVLGQSIFIHRDRSFGRVRPLYEVLADGFREIDVKKEFPAEGLAYWKSPNPSVEDRDFVLFSPEENGEAKDSFKVGSPSLVFEVVDVRSISSEQLRDSLRDGIQGAINPRSKVFLWTREYQVLGPIRLVQQSDRWTVDPGEQLHDVPLYARAKLDLKKAPDGRWFVFPPTPSAEEAVDWSPDEAVFRRALTYLSSQSDDAGLSLTQKQAVVAAHAVAAQGDTRKLKLEQYRIEQLQRRIGEITRNGVLRKVVSETIVGLPHVRDLIEQAIVRETSAALAAGTDELANLGRAIEAEREQLSKLRSEKEGLVSELLTHRADRERHLLEIEAEFARRIQQALESPAKLLVESAMLRAVMPVVSGRVIEQDAAPAAGTTQAEPTVSERPALISWDQPARALVDHKDVSRALTEALRRRAVTTKAARVLHAALLTRSVPLLSGVGASEALGAFADAIAGGRIHRILLSPTMVDATDLLRRVVPAVGFSPSGNGLSDVLDEAVQNPEKLVVVAFEAANRAPTEGVLLPWARAAAGGDSGTVPVLGCKSFRWPKNVLLAATLAEGPTTLPVSPDVLAYSVFVPLDLEELAAPHGETSAPSLSEVPVRSGMLQLTAVAPAGPSKELLDGVDGADLPPSFRARLRVARVGAERIAAGLARVPGADQRVVRRVLSRGCFAPAIAANSGLTDEVVTALQAHLTDESDAPSLVEVAELAKRWWA